MEDRHEWALTLDDAIKGNVKALRESMVNVVLLLSEMQANRLYQELGYHSIREYVIGSGIYHERMGYHIQKIITNKILSQYIHENPEKAKEIGVSKFIELSGEGLVNEFNVSQWADKAMAAKTVNELKKQIETVMNDRGLESDHPQSFHCTFARRGSWQLLRDALDIVKRITCADGDAEALEAICQDFIAGNPDLYGLLIKEREK